MTTIAAPRPMELPAAKLRWRCELSRIPFETTAQAELREGFIGQERALRALKMGAELSAPGYNVFVCGLAGHQRRGNNPANGRRTSPADQRVPRPLLRQQFQIDGPAAAAGARARPGERF